MSEEREIEGFGGHEAVEVEFVIDGWAYRAVYDVSDDGTRGRFRMYIDDDEIDAAADSWTGNPPVMDVEDVAMYAHETLTRLYDRAGWPMPRGDAFVEDLRKRFQPSRYPEPDADGDGLVERLRTQHPSDPELVLTWSLNDAGTVGRARAEHRDSLVFDEIWRARDGRTVGEWEAVDLIDWADQRAAD